MKVVNRINNNVVLVTDGIQFMIVTGKGLGFKVYPDDLVDESLIEQRYIMQESDVVQYVSILKEIPKEYLDIARDVVSIGEEKLGRRFPVSLIFALADHMYYAYQRALRNQSIEHPLQWEINQLYPDELGIASFALEKLNHHLLIDLPDSECVFIAMHFINYSFESSSDYNPQILMEKLNGALSVLDDCFDETFDRQSSTYSRFIVHLRFYIIRLLRFEAESSNNNQLVDTIRDLYPVAYQCATKITDYLNPDSKNKDVETEKVYLALHINRLIESRRESMHGKQGDRQKNT